MKKINLLLLLSAFLFACGGNSGKEEAQTEEAPTTENTDPMKNKGIGPVTSVTLTDIDQEMVAEGKTIFENMCTACHKADKKFIGPSPQGILDRRTPEWVMNMILNPEEMVEKDPIAKQLLVEHNGAPMADQNLTEDQARKVLEYFRTL